MIVKLITFEVILIYKRLRWLFSGVCCMFIVLGIRLVYLQVIFSGQLINEGNSRSLRVQNIPESRGVITDRMGRLLAVNIPVDSIYIDPKLINQSGGIYADIANWIKLSNILGISLEKMNFFIHRHEMSRFLYLSRHVDPIDSQYISQLKIPGVYLKHTSKRYYPTGEDAAHLVGITNIDNQGIEGIEKSFNSCLSGYPKIKIVYQDRVGRVIEDVKVLHQGESAKNITLTIDNRLQHLAYHELNKAININNAVSGSIVLVDINTGEILAMANIPSYNPNNLIKNVFAMRNRAITDIFEPGSTIKPIIVMAALDQKIISENTVLNTLPYMINGHQIKDVSIYNHLTISEILQKSSNVGVSKLALSLPTEILVNSFLNFGAGKLTNIELIGENKGKMYSCDRYYSAIAKATLSYGYGLMMTPLQLARMYAIIGGMERSRPLSIIKFNKPIAIPSLENQFFSKSVIRSVVRMMEVTTSSRIGCYQAAIEGYRVAVKTGTIKQVGLNGKYINKYISCIAGFAPVSNPQLALVIVINDPKNGRYYGASVSAPVFKSVMSEALKIMNINPDYLNK